MSHKKIESETSTFPFYISKGKIFLKDSKQEFLNYKTTKSNRKGYKH
jgi:hypothetical protein